MRSQKKHPKKFKRVAANSKEKQLKSLENEQESKAIIDTLAYKGIFSASVSAWQLWYFLISNKEVKSVNFLTSLEALISENTVLKKGVKPTLYLLPSQKYSEYKEGYEISRRFLKKAAATANYLKRIPWIKMVAVTGSTAAYNSTKDSDIDMLILTSKSRVWITRLFVVLVLKALNIYWNEKKPAGTICPNIFLSENNLAWPKSKRNVYTANEIALMFPIYYKNNAYFSFLDQNDWLLGFLPNLEGSITNSKAYFKQKTRKKSVNRDFLLVNTAEKLVMLLQKFYMRKKITKETVHKDFIHFNKHDHSEEILTSFNNRS